MSLKTITTISPILLLSGCLSLPAEQTSTQRHYNLLPASKVCKINSSSPLKLSITEVGTGLNSNRIFQVSKTTGEISYLSNMRWPSETASMLKQRLAADFEQAGLSVITSHRQRADINRLNCELRALNLELDEQNHAQARFTMSCSLYSPKENNHASIRINQHSAIQQLNGNMINQALSHSYSLGFEALCQALAK